MNTDFSIANVELNSLDSPFELEMKEWACQEISINPSNLDNIIKAKLIISTCLETHSNILELSNLQLSSIPLAIGSLSSLEYLSLCNNNLTALPDKLFKLSNLHSLFLSINKLSTISQEITNLSKLKILDIRRNNFLFVPLPVCKLKGLIKFFISANDLKFLPPEFMDLIDLEELDLSFNSLSDSSIPVLSTLSRLNYLSLSHNYKLNFNPRIFLKTPQLKILDYGNIYLSNAFLDNLFAVMDYENSVSGRDIFLDSIFELNIIKHKQLESNMGYNLIKFGSNLFSQFANIFFRSIFRFNPTKERFLLNFNHSFHPKQKLELMTKFCNMLEFFFIENHSGEPQKLISNIIPSLERILNSDSSQVLNIQQKKSLFFELWSIMSNIYKKRNNTEFLQQVDCIALESLSSCDDFNIFMIFNLKNFCNKKSLNELIKLNKSAIFNYIKQQLIYIFILELAREKCHQIKLINSSFSEDAEVYLNFIRIFNINFGEKLQLNLPPIIHQNFLSLKKYQPSEDQISKFKNIVESFDNSRYQTLCELIANQIAKEIYDPKDSLIPEISSLKFINNLKSNFDEIVLDIYDKLNRTESIEESNENDKKRIIANEIRQLQIEEFTHSLTKELVGLINKKELLEDDSNQQQIAGFSEIELKQLKKKFTDVYKNSLIKHNLKSKLISCDDAGFFSEEIKNIGNLQQSNLLTSQSSQSSFVQRNCEPSSNPSSTTVVESLTTGQARF
jgi:hypothetical protein